MRVLAVARLCFALLVFLSVLYFYFYHTGIGVNYSEGKSTIESSSVGAIKRIFNSNGHNITLAVVACGDRLQETLTMLKSAIMLTKQHIKIIIITEDNLIENFNEKLAQWQETTNNAFGFKVMPLTFPKDNTQEWRKLFKPCASQRLFLPNVLSEIDSILYVDTDTLFLTPVEDVWDHFNQMNSSQMAALAPEHEDPNVAWYNRFARHPYYGPLGVNSGVMLMNLTRMRQFQWVDYVIPIYKRYKLKITWGDQDIINIIFHFHPDKLFIYPCRYNFRPDHCMYMSVCKSAERAGVAVLHGSRGFFHSEKQPVFSSIYRAFEEFQLGNDIYEEFFMPLENYLDLAGDSNCGKIPGIYLKNLKNFIDIKDTL
ncbi:glucoside xylosyltransferase 2-like [Atheta coriaria]|uniref:glucoside xylosyltransferase 2-like n=1 Tax=Dalotia coriaria TaxID=877792 RepID=UPI0031F44140